MNEIEKKNLVNKIIKEMDQKTGLNGSFLPVFFSNSTNRKGAFYSKKNNSKGVFINFPVKFKFSNYLFDGRYNTEVIEQVIKHEYIHYYCCVKYPTKIINHGEEFKNACLKYDVNPSVYFNYELNDNIENLNLEKKLVFVITCISCKNENIRQKETKIVKNINKYKCGVCGGKLECKKDYRLID